MYLVISILLGSAKETLKGMNISKLHGYDIELQS